MRRHDVHDIGIEEEEAGNPIGRGKIKDILGRWWSNQDEGKRIRFAEYEEKFTGTWHAHSLIHLPPIPMCFGKEAHGVRRRRASVSKTPVFVVPGYMNAGVIRIIGVAKSARSFVDAR
jgi:hypothetical protein